MTSYMINRVKRFSSIGPVNCLLHIGTAKKIPSKTKTTSNIHTFTEESTNKTKMLTEVPKCQSTGGTLKLSTGTLKLSQITIITVLSRKSL